MTYYENLGLNRPNGCFLVNVDIDCTFFTKNTDYNFKMNFLCKRKNYDRYYILFSELRDTCKKL
jgi:hypothetical protein